MKENLFLNDLAKRLYDVLPQNMQKISADLEQNFSRILKNTFTKFDLVTHEEFDAQSKVLARSRKKVELLEMRVRELEKMITERGSDD